MYKSTGVGKRLIGQYNNIVLVGKHAGDRRYMYKSTGDGRRSVQQYCLCMEICGRKKIQVKLHDKEEGQYNNIVLVGKTYGRKKVYV